ncbi:MAG: hypothetical protein IPO91_05715 [Chloroflexi bacterium]|nr:hypothetical protein [Chloroflexota bacterium]
MRKWDVQTGENVLRITGHTGTIWSLMAALDNRYVVSSSSDNTVRLWNAQTGAELRRFSGHTGAVWGVAMTDDSRFVLSASRDGSARLWDVNVDDTISYVCSRLRREFTAAEREQFQIFDQQPTCPQFAPVSVVMLPTPTATVNCHRPRRSPGLRDRSRAGGGRRSRRARHKPGCGARVRPGGWRAGAQPDFVVGGAERRSRKRIGLRRAGVVHRAVSRRLGLRLLLPPERQRALPPDRRLQPRLCAHSL